MFRARERREAPGFLLLIAAVDVLLDPVVRVWVRVWVRLRVKVRAS